MKFEIKLAIGKITVFLLHPSIKLPELALTIRTNTSANISYRECVGGKSRKRFISTGNILKKELEEARQGGVRKKKKPTIFAKLKTHMYTWELFYF